MKLSLRKHVAADNAAIHRLFSSVFAQFDGPDAGRLIGKLVSHLLSADVSDGVFGFVAEFETTIVGSILFSPLHFADDTKAILLSPVAIHDNYQRQGIGQRLIHHGLKALKDYGVSWVVTYGDPAFYAKVGFESISPHTVRPPFPLTQPEGWLAQSLCDADVETLSDKVTTVSAFNDPIYW